jgi:hypothetical protein
MYTVIPSQLKLSEICGLLFSWIPYRFTLTWANLTRANLTRSTSHECPGFVWAIGNYAGGSSGHEVFLKGKAFPPPRRAGALLVVVWALPFKNAPRPEPPPIQNAIYLKYTINTPCYHIHNHHNILHYLTSFRFVSLSHCKLSSLSHQRPMHEEAMV